MIQLGMTDCAPVRNLLNQSEIDLDYLEVHGPFLADARAAFPEKPMLLHNSLYQWSLVHPDGLKYKNAGELTIDRLQLAASPWFSLHLGFSCAEVDFLDEAMQALSPVLPEEIVFERSVQCINQLVEILPVPVLIENLDYNPTGAYEYICSPDFIRRVLEQTNTFLLLDLAHAQVTASAMQVPVEEYISQLPLEKVRQIHLNRPGWRDGRLVDSHQMLEDDGYALLESVLKVTHPWAVTLEYNLDQNQIPQQIRRLRKILEATNL